VLGRPETERPGTFKKASNLNFTLRLVDAGAAPERGSMSHEAAIEAALALRLGDDHRRSAYARGELVVGEVALLLDKDSSLVSQSVTRAALSVFSRSARPSALRGRKTIIDISLAS
jgi:hypothetical protein